MTLPTTSFGDADGMVGDFAQLLIGLRQQAELSVSFDANDAFTQNSAYIRVVWRGDIQTAHRDAFSHITTIS